MLRKTLFALVLLSTSACFANDWEDGYEAYQRRDFKLAMQKWNGLAAAGDVQAQSIMGMMYSFGQGVPLNFTIALQWLRLAAAQGEHRAIYKIGMMHGNGQGLPKNPANAYKWLLLAQAAGHQDSARNIGRFGNELDAEAKADAKTWAARCLKRSYKGCGD